MAYKTPTQIRKFFDANMHRMDVPVQWMGDEPNSYRKSWDDASVRVLLSAMWGYEQASGNLAIPLVYRVINEWREQFLADRCYLPSTMRDMRILEAGGIPIHGIESKHQLRDFDVFGTSISYPVLAVNFVKQLLMSDVPATWADRQTMTGQTVPGRHRNPEKWPFVIVGGQCYGAPEVVANIADCVFLGEVEDEPGNPGFGAVIDRIEVFKKNGVWSTDRMGCYAKLAVEFNFLYFPCFVDVHYSYEDRPTVAEAYTALGQEGEVRPSKQVIGYSTTIPRLRAPFVKRIVKDMDKVEGLTNPPLLYNDPGMGAGDVEAARGCPAWCSFCALTYRQKPYRQRSVKVVVDQAAEIVKNTGAVHVAPFSPDFPMHTQKKKLIKGLLENVSDDVDASSMRVDDFIADPSYILLQAHGGMDSVTLGVEGNSQRMRDLVGKGAADEDVKEAVARGIQAGISKFKLYMIASLPGEDTGDIYRCLTLARELADIRDSMGSKAKIQFSWTPMLIEGNTPFQWFAPTTANYALGEVFEEIRDLKIDFRMGGKAQRDKHMFFQLAQRASREIGLAMVEAIAEMNVGCWGGAPKGLCDKIEQRMQARGFLNGFADAWDERYKQDMFGWEMVDQGINVELLWVTYQQMVEFLENTDSETYDEQFTGDYHGSEWIQRCDEHCYGKTCSVCDPADLKLRRNYIQAAADEISVDLTQVNVIDQRSVAQKVRCKVVKGNEKRFVMNDHFVYAVRRAANRVGLPLAKRSIKFASDNLKYRDWTSGVDYMEFALTQALPPLQAELVLKLMNIELGPSLQITDHQLLPIGADSILKDVDLSLYEIEIDVPWETANKAMSEWHAAEYVPMLIREDHYLMGMQTEEVNAKEYVDDLWFSASQHRLKLRMFVRGKANPYAVYAAMFGKRSWVEAAKYPAVRCEAFVEHDSSVIDFWHPQCVECGNSIPVNPLDQPFDPYRCPKCADRFAKLTVEV